MLRRQLIAYPAAALFAVAGTTYSYHAVRPTASKVVQAVAALSGEVEPHSARPAAAPPTRVALAAPRTVTVVRHAPLAPILPLAAPGAASAVRRIVVVNTPAGGPRCASCAAVRRVRVIVRDSCRTA